LIQFELQHRIAMRIDRLLFVIGFALYAGAFFLPAVFEAGSAPLRGYDCALVTLIQVWTHDNRALIHEEPVTYISLLVSGWINPLFLLTAIFTAFRKARKLAGILRILVLVMIPFCWIAFHNVKVRPREGHFLWIIGMLLVLFSNQFRPADEKMLPRT
jgi:hypothetical protein